MLKKATTDQKICKLHDAEKRLTADLDQRRSDLDATTRDLAVATAASYVDGGEAGADVGPVVRLREEIVALDAAIDGVRQQRREALLERYREQAAGLRHEAADARAAAEKTKERAEKLLAELVAVEGVRYIPPGSTPVALMADGGFVRAVGPMTRTQSSLAQADSLEAQARELLSRTAPAAGEARGDALSELVEASTADPR